MHVSARKKQNEPQLPEGSAGEQEQMQPSTEDPAPEPYDWGTFPVEPPAWPGALAEEWKDYPWEDETPAGEDITLDVPFYGWAEGMDLIRQHAVLAMRQLERARWVYRRDTEEIIKRPDPELWRKYRIAPGHASVEGDDYGVGSVEQVQALKDQWRSIIIDEIHAEEERKRDAAYDPAQDPFYQNVFHGVNTDAEPAALKCFARMLATADKSVHKKAFFDIGWWRAQTIAREQNEADAGIRLSKIERARRHYQSHSDYAESEEEWLLYKPIEMQKWDAIEQGRLQVTLGKDETDETANLTVALYVGG